MFDKNTAIANLLGEDSVAIHTRGSAYDDILVVLSGGQDSATVLGFAESTRKGDAKIHAISFDYGQRHGIELECAKRLSEYCASWTLVKADCLNQLADSALTREGDVSAEHRLLPGRPASFVPNRNAFFLTLAHAHAIKLGVNEVWAGMCETDYSGYPDCRRSFIDAMQHALNEGSEQLISIATPLMKLNKAQTFALAAAVGWLGIVVNETHTCYNGVHDEDHRHEWGYGCGECPACQLRAKGWEVFRKAGEV